MNMYVWFSYLLWGTHEFGFDPDSGFSGVHSDLWKFMNSNQRTPIKTTQG